MFKSLIDLNPPEYFKSPYDFHECLQNDSSVEIVKWNNGKMEMWVPRDCGDPQCSCVSESKIVCCPFCGEK